VLRGARPPIDVQFREIQPGKIFAGDDFSVTAFQVYHRGSDCFGYAFEEKTRRPFLADRADALEIPHGPWRRDLVSGESVTLPDGRQIDPDQVLGEPRPGTKVVHVGDTGRVEDLLGTCQDADVLVIESTYLQGEAEMAHDFAHLTASQAAQLAVDANVKQLILTHISRRYRERDVIAEARAVFANARVARDFDAFQVRRGKMVKFDLQNR
jgi:ribonuclease Z